MFCSYVKYFCFLSSEDFPSSGVLLQRSDEATEEKAVLDTFLAGRSLVAKRNQQQRKQEKIAPFFGGYKLNCLVTVITPVSYGTKHDDLILLIAVYNYLMRRMRWRLTDMDHFPALKCRSRY